jgi:hypothetical protein
MRSSGLGFTLPCEHFSVSAAMYLLDCFDWEFGLERIARVRYVNAARRAVTNQELEGIMTPSA